MGIGKNLRQAMDKISLCAAGYYANVACGNLQICDRLEYRIDGATNTARKIIEERD